MVESCVTVCFIQFHIMANLAQTNTSQSNVMTYVTNYGILSFVISCKLPAKSLDERSPKISQKLDMLQTKVQWHLYSRHGVCKFTTTTLGPKMQQYPSYSQCILIHYCWNNRDVNNVSICMLSTSNSTYHVQLTPHSLQN